MFIEKIDMTHLKVELSDIDMEGLEINYSSFAYENEHSRTIIKFLLKKAYEQTGFLYTNCKLLIEVFPTTDSGCMILFTKMKSNKKVRLKLTSANKGMIFEFNNIENLIISAKPLIEANIPEDNRLYFYKGKYYLYIDTKLGNLKKLYLVLTEFSTHRCIQNEAVLAEYGKLICDNNAIKKIRMLT